MSKDFIHNNILQAVADAIRYCDDTTAGIAPVDYAERIRALDKLIPQPDALNFYMPNGGTITLNKIGSPTVVELEYSLDRGATWTVWQEDDNGNRSLVLSAGQKVYIRNTSETQTRFSTNTSAFYKFAFTSTVEAHGNTNSLLCKSPENVTSLSSYCYYRLFAECSFLVIAPELPTTTLANACYYGMFRLCTSLVKTPELPSTVLFGNCYRAMFYNCTTLMEIRTLMTDISANNCISNWLTNVSATGDFYCPAELTISTGIDGIPSSWTRHDI